MFFFQENLIRGLDDDEVDFLDVIDRAKMDADKKQQLEERNELRDFREKVASLQEKTLTEVCTLLRPHISRLYTTYLIEYILQKLQAEVSKPKPKITSMSTRPSQKSILAGMVRKRKVSSTTDEGTTGKSVKVSVPEKTSSTESELEADKDDANGVLKVVPVTTLHCIGILPGIGKYTESSDSDKSTDTDEDYDYSSYDWIGRQILKDTKSNESHAQ